MRKRYVPFSHDARTRSGIEREYLKSVTLMIVEGESVGEKLTLAEFLEANEGFKDDFPKLLTLKIGDTFSDGGGASPRWTVRRVA